MTRYLIKCTYLDGRFEGKSYLQQKRGYVTESEDCQTTYTTYASYGIAMRECRKLKSENTIDWDCETIYRERYHITRYRITDHMDYIPYPVEFNG